jgi:hypothetical protein
MTDKEKSACNGQLARHAVTIGDCAQPLSVEDLAELMARLRRMPPRDLMDLMLAGVSDCLAHDPRSRESGDSLTRALDRRMLALLRSRTANPAKITLVVGAKVPL